MNKFAERLCYGSNTLAQTRDVFLLLLGCRMFDSIEAVGRKPLTLIECGHQALVGLGGEVANCKAHGGECRLEVVARVRKRRRAFDAGKGRRDVRLPRGEGDAVCQEAHNRNQRERNDTGADRQRLEKKSFIYNHLSHMK